MPRYVALLRGINVGGNQRVAMADLRELLSGLGTTEVRTHLQSGNAVFTSSSAEPEQLASQIERCIQEQMGLIVRCLVRSTEEMDAVIHGNPFRDVATDGSKMIVLFLSKSPDPNLLAAHDPTKLGPEEIRLGDRVVYQWCQSGVLEAPPVGVFVEKHLKVTVTARNWNTVTKLGALLNG